MKQIFCTLAVLASLQPVATAQNISKVDAFAGFSILNYDGVFGGRDDAYGGQASVTFNPARWFGVTADFGGQRKNYTNLYSNGSLITPFPIDATSYEFLFGPQFALRSRHATFFVHSLFGTLRQVSGTPIAQSVTLTVSNTSFLMGFGGGMDLNAGRHFAIRVVQFDWLPDRNGGVWSTDAIRLGFGVVVK